MGNFFTSFYVICVIFLFNITCRAEVSFLNEIKNLYQFENWAGSTKTNYVKIIQNWEVDISTYGATNFYSKPYLPNSLIIRQGQYVFQPTNMASRVYVRVVETPNVLEAHKTLMNHFSLCSAIQPFQTGISIGVNIGDHCYAGYPIGSTNSLTFVRNNMFINISSGNPPESVYEIANKIDQQLLEASVKICESD